MSTVLMAACAAYLAGAWATALAIGYTGLEDKGFFVFVFSCVWPLFWILMVVITAKDKIEETMGREGVDRAKNVLNVMTIMFRPYSAGRMLREWYEGRKPEEKGSD